MPFVTEEHREKPDSSIAGDRCYLEACPIWKAWQENPRWTTIDEQWKAYEPDDKKRALLLALLVHMGLYGLDYERRKRAENGDIYPKELL